MINLLPTDYANSIRFGRQNTVLRAWLLGMLSAITGLIVIIAGGWLYIDRQSHSLQKNIDATNLQLKTQNLAQVQSDAKEISGDIKVINKVLSKEVRFSDLIQAIGNDMPPRTVLGSLSLTNVSGTLDLTAGAKDYASAAQIAANLSDPKNGLFSKVDIININCKSTTSPNYICNITLKALFSSAAKTRFLSVPKGSQS